jgi:hypothetical protein
MLERYKTWGGTLSCAGRQLLEVDNKRSKEKLMEEINQYRTTKPLELS